MSENPYPKYSDKADIYTQGYKQGKNEVTKKIKQRLQGMTVGNINNIVNTHISKYGLVNAFMIPENFAEMTTQIHALIQEIKNER